MQKDTFRETFMGKFNNSFFPRALRHFLFDRTRESLKIHLTEVIHDVFRTTLVEIITTHITPQ